MSTLLAQMADLERGHRIKELREANHMTQPAVAEAIGITLRAYQKYEAGGGLRYDNAKALADVFEVDVATILGRRPVETASQLDRIERKLDLLLSQTGLDDAAEIQRAIREAPLPVDEPAADSLSSARVRSRHDPAS